MECFLVWASEGAWRWPARGDQAPLHPKLKAGNNVRKNYMERGNSLQGFLSPKFCVLQNTVPLWVNHPLLHLPWLLRRRHNIIHQLTWPASHNIWKCRQQRWWANLPAAALNIKDLREAIWVVEQGPELYFSGSEIKAQILLLWAGMWLEGPGFSLQVRQLYSFSCKIKRRRSSGGNLASFSERWKGNLGQRMLFNIFSLLKLLSGGGTDVTT